MESLAQSQYYFEDERIASRFIEHYDDVRGTIRLSIIKRHLSEVASLHDTVLRILDIGCGDAREAAWLAEMGHEVVAFDLSEQMLQRAEQYLKESGETQRVTLVHGDSSDALEQFGEESFDLVLSHGVLMYQADPNAFIANHVALTKRMGHLSILTKNAGSLAFRAANEGHFQEAMRLLDDTNSVGNLGVETRADSIDDIANYLADEGSTVLSWAGVRIFSDSGTQDVELMDPAALIELEWRACRQDPYRGTGALLHVVALKGIEMNTPFGSLAPEVR